jgi:hypothetical protein
MAEARLTAVVDTRGAVKAEKELNKIAKTAKVVDINVKKTGKSFKTFGSNAAKAVAAIDGPLGGISSRITAITSLASGGSIAFAGLAAAITVTAFALIGGVKELDKLNLGLAKSEALIKATGSAAGFSAVQLQEQAQALALVTLASTEGVQKAQAILQTYNRVNGEVFTRAITLGQDLAAVLGGDVASQTTLIGKALQDPIKGISSLNRVGVTFTATQKEQIELFIKGGDVAEAQGVILANLASQVAGAGGAVAKDSLAGAFDTTSQLYSEFIANLADSTGAYTSTITLVNKLNDALKVNSQLSDENSRRNFDTLFKRRQELQSQIDRLEGGSGNAQRALPSKRNELIEVEKELARIQDVQKEKGIEATKAAIKGDETQAANRKEDIKAQEKELAAKAEKQKTADDAKLARSKASAQRELETLLSLNNSELEAINTKEQKRLSNVKLSRDQELVTEQEFQAAKTQIELNASESRQALLDEEAEKNKVRRDEELIGVTENIKSVTDSLVDAAVSGGNLGDAVIGAVRGIATQIIKSGIDILVQEQIVNKVASAAFLTSKAAEVASTTAQAGLNAFAATAAIPVVGPGLAPAAAVLATSTAAALGGPVIAAAAAREQGGQLSAGQSSTVAERGQLEILTPTSSSRIRTAQQMKQLMGDDSGSNSTINIVNIDQSSNGVSIESSVDEDGRIIQMIRDTTALDATNPNSELRKSFAATTTLEARR